MNTGGLGFDVFDDQGMVAFYNYSQLPVNMVFDAPINQEYIFFKVCDNDDPDCCDEIEFLNPCYQSSSNCEIYDLSVITECYTSGGFFWMLR